MEKLALLNTLRLHTWKVHINTSDEDLRSVLLLVRNLNIRNFILLTSDLEETRLLNVVSIYHKCSEHFSLSLRTIADFSWMILNQRHEWISFHCCS